MKRTFVLPFVILLTMLASCNSGPQRKQSPALPDPVTEELRVAKTLPAQGLNIGVQVFDSVGKFTSLYTSVQQVRSVERRYLPYQLKMTLDRSGYWGAVRVMPQEDRSAELGISGTILASDGVELELAIRVLDATGRVWLDRTYQDVASGEDYDRDAVNQKDPFQDLYNRIANDLSQQLEMLAAADLKELLDVATLRYARDLSPESFSRHLQETGQGQLVLAGLPALDDPMFDRVRRIRESEYLFADSIDAHYKSLQRKVDLTYAWWRYYSHELIVGNRRLETIDATRSATRGSWYSLERVYKTYKESRMNEDALRELTESFDRETAPTVTEIAGKVVQLHGTLDFQVSEWRRLLREAYRQEMGR